jgi:hypothetical protein
MRYSAIIAKILFATFLLSFRLPTNPVYITGHLKRNPKDTSAYVVGVTIFVKGDNKLLATTVTDSLGDCKLTFTPDGEKSFDFFCAGLGIDTLLLSSITRFESDTPEMTFYIPGHIKKNVLSRVICPKCKRTDKVYEIQYGDAPVATKQASRLGDTTYSPIYKGKYQASCIVGPAKFYCNRDRVKF